MDDETLEQLERQLADLPRIGAPAALRASVLAQMQRELGAARWDRRLARAAAVLLLAGAGLNAGIIMWGSITDSMRARPWAQVASRQTLVDTAVLVAEATDAATGSQFARQLAAMSGRELTADDAAAIDAAIGRSPGVHRHDHRSKG